MLRTTGDASAQVCAPLQGAFTENKSHFNRLRGEVLNTSHWNIITEAEM